MHAADVISGALLGGGAVALARAAWLATAGAPPPSSGRPNRTALWGTSGLIAVGCGVYVREVWAGPPPLHPAGTTAGDPWWQVAAVSAAVLAAAAAAGVAVLAARTAAAVRRRRRRYRRSIGDGDLSALTTRHDAIREQYGALLAAEPYRLDQLAAALARAADLQPKAAASYTHRSEYARAVGEAEAAWQPLAAAARRQGLALPDADQLDS
ncbi:MAG: hypothetical protein JO362_22140 [Streptomycetaceae bacterium]|nr:hypothetical protein [Kutzneria sp.]MBV9026427.1 hypothetical protein [Streptomycetaceae bacterium]